MPLLGRTRPPGIFGSARLPALQTTRNPGSLVQWATALAGLNSTPARWLSIGDGPAEGQGASTRANRWVDQVLSTIRTAKSSPTGQAFVSAAYQVTGPNSPWASTGVALGGSATAGTASGLGQRIVTLSQGGTSSGQFGTSAFGTAAFGGSSGGSTPGSVTFTVTGTTADLWYVSEATSGNFTYAVDGGTPVTVSTAGAHDIQRIGGITLGANTSHTVAVNLTAGTVYISGLTVYGLDSGTGIHLYDSARTGATSATFSSGIADVTDVAATIAPDLVTIAVGYNDGGAGIPPGQTAANVSTVITMLKALPKVPSIVLVINPYPAGAAVADWPGYVPGLRSIPTVDPTIGLVDLTLTLPLADLSGTGLYRADGKFPNDSGHAAWAAQVAAFTNVTLIPAGVAATAGRQLLLSGIA